MPQKGHYRRPNHPPLTPKKFSPIHAANNGEYADVTLEKDDSIAEQRLFVSEDQDIHEYKTIASFHYPMRRETRSRQEIIFDDANYYLYMFAQVTVSKNDTF